MTDLYISKEEMQIIEVLRLLDGKDLHFSATIEGNLPSCEEHFTHYNIAVFRKGEFIGSGKCCVPCYNRHIHTLQPNYAWKIIR